MKYKINSNHFRKLINLGIQTTLKGYSSYNKTNITLHHNYAWDTNIKNVHRIFIDGRNFNDC